MTLDQRLLLPHPKEGPSRVVHPGLMLTVLIASGVIEVYEAHLDDALYNFPEEGYISAEESHLVTIVSTVTIKCDDRGTPNQVVFELKTEPKGAQNLSDVWESVKLGDEVVSCLFTPSPYLAPLSSVNLGPSERLGSYLTMTSGLEENTPIDDLERLKDILSRPETNS